MFDKNFKNTNFLMIYSFYICVYVFMMSSKQDVRLTTFICQIFVLLYLEIKKYEKYNRPTVQIKYQN